MTRLFRYALRAPFRSRASRRAWVRFTGTGGRVVSRLCSFAPPVALSGLAGPAATERRP